MEEQKQKQEYFEIPEETVELRKQLEQYSIANESLTKDYQRRGQEITMLEGKVNKLTREKEEAEKQLNDLVIHTQTKREQMKNLTVEIPSKLLYSLALDWQIPSPGSVYVCCDRDTGEVRLKTPQDMEQKEATFVHPMVRYGKWV